jgi:hypothetical protein
MRGTEITIAKTVTARILCSIPSKIAVPESNQFTMALTGSHPCSRCLLIYFEAFD